MPFPATANNGMINMNSTNDAPIRSPTNIAGSRSITELTPTDNSGMDVSIPRMKNDAENDDRCIFRANRLMLLIMSSEEYQSPTNENKKKNKCVANMLSV